ncbi:MAG: amidase [Streptosporangiales bacterium]|nr:amidase [Streptosporangiales bacterium]
MSDDIAFRTATDLVAAYSRGELSPVEATRAVLDRIERLNPAVNAFCLVDAERAAQGARDAERRWHRGQPSGLLDGVPVSIKDVFLTLGWPTLRGSRAIDPDQPWQEDAPAVARLREQGAVLVGKTTTPEIGWKGVTDSPLTGVTRNPWETGRTPGGSSGGSAAAIALGMAPLTVGTDGGGSVRIPAAFCGVFGFKPTYGRIPLYPASPFGTLAHAGPLTRTVGDAALMLDVLSRPDSRDWSALEPPASSYVGRLNDGVSGLRVAYSPTLGGASVDKEVAALVQEGVRALAELGAHVDEVDPGFQDPVDALHVLWFSGAAKSVASFPPERRTDLDPGLAEICEVGARASAMEYLDATVRRMDLGRHMGVFHETYDLLVTPAMPILPFTAGQEVPGGWPSRRWTSWAPFSYPFNLTQQPAASLPCGLTGGSLPVGLQIVGPRHADARVLAASRALEEARPWAHLRPPLAAG